MTEKFVSAAEAAKAFCVTPNTVRRWAKEGKLSAVRTPGGRFRIPSAALDLAAIVIEETL